MQNMIDRMIVANLVLRVGHGQYAVADPFVRKAWRQRQALLTPPAAAAPP